MDVSECAPWQNCRTCGLDLPTSWTITGVRGAARGHPLASAKSSSSIYSIQRLCLVINAKYQGEDFCGYVHTWYLVLLCPVRYRP